MGSFGFASPLTEGVTVDSETASSSGKDLLISSRHAAIVSGVQFINACDR